MKLGPRGSARNWRPTWIRQRRAVEDLRGRPGRMPPLRSKIFSISCISSEILTKSYMLVPPPRWVGAPSPVGRRPLLQGILDPALKSVMKPNQRLYMSHFSYACKTKGENGISCLISALCVNCLSSIPEYSRIIDYSIIWMCIWCGQL